MEFIANIANLGKYSAGQLTETLLSFPTTTEQVKAALQEISGGCYTPQGYIFNNRRTPFKVIYDGQHIPGQYRVFRYPIQQKIKTTRSGRSRDSPSHKRP